MRLINLLDLMARYGRVKSESNFQKLPKKIKFDDMEFHLVYNVDNDYTIVYEADDNTKGSYNVADLFEGIANYRYEETLNEEVEILEDDDKLSVKSSAFVMSDSGTISLPDDDKISHIEEIENLSSCDLWIKNDRLNDYVANVLNKNSGIFYKKINELIDKVNDMELDRRMGK